MLASSEIDFFDKLVLEVVGTYIPSKPSSRELSGLPQSIGAGVSCRHEHDHRLYLWYAPPSVPPSGLASLAKAAYTGSFALASFSSSVSPSVSGTETVMEIVVMTPVSNVKPAIISVATAMRDRKKALFGMMSPYPTVAAVTMLK